MKTRAHYIALLPASLLAACGYCGGKTTDVSTLALPATVLTATGLASGDEASVSADPFQLDSNGHPESTSMFFNVYDSAGSGTATADGAAIGKALAATGTDLRKAHQALPAGTMFTLPATGQQSFSGFTSVRVTVAEDEGTVLTLTIDASDASAGFSLSGTAPFAYDDIQDTSSCG